MSYSHYCLRAEPESNVEEILMVVNETVEVEEDVVETEEDVEVVEVEEDVVEMEEDGIETEENVEEVEAKVEVEEVMREVPDTFLSLGLGPRLIQRGWLKFNTRLVCHTLTSPGIPASLLFILPQLLLLLQYQ